MKIVIRLVSWTAVATALFLALTVLITVGVVFWLFFTETGGRWALEQVPNLEVREYSGVLGGEWSAEQIVYSADETRVSVEQARMVWRPSCLLRVKVCLDGLYSESIDVSLPEGEQETEPRTEAIALPSIEVPFRLALEDAVLGRLTINEIVAFDRLELAADMAGSRLRLDHLAVERDTSSATLGGRVQMQGDWPLQARLTLGQGLGESLDRLQLSSDLSGSVSNIILDTELHAPWQALLSGQVQPLEPGVPVDLELATSRFHYSPDLMDTLALSDVLIRARGDLDAGWDVTGDAILETEPGTPVSLAGHVDLERARVDHLNLDLSEHQYLRLAEGRVDWTEQLLVEADLDWRNFPWLRLFPEMEAPPVVLEQAALAFALRGSDYHGELDGYLSTSEGPVHVSTPFNGDFSGIRLPQLALSAAQGRIDGRLDLGWDELFRWDADLALAGVNPGFWLEELAGDLSGSLRSRGSLPEEGLELDADVDISGELREQPVQLAGRGSLAGENWTLRELDLRFGDNRLSGNARQAGQIDADLHIGLSALDQFWPGLAGQLEGRVAASDLLGKPQGMAQLDGQALAWEPQEIELESLSLRATLHEALGGEATLSWSGLSAAEQMLDAGRIEFQGDEADHRLSVHLVHPMVELDLGAQGGWQNGAWQGSVISGAVAAFEQLWLLQTPAELSVDPREAVVLGAHCWGWDEASLCADEQQLFPEQKLALGLNNMPTRIVQPWLPPDVRWDDNLDAYVNISLGAEGPRGNLWVDAGSGRVEVLRTIDPDDMDAFPDAERGETERWMPIHYERLRAEGELDPESVRLTFDLAGPELGAANAELSLDTRNEDYPIEGRFRLEDLDLAIARPFLDLDVVEGQLQGQAQLSGPLRMPDVEGELQLTQGRLSDPRIPMRFDTLELQVLVGGNRAEIGGQWSSGDEGTGEVSGEASWSDGLVANVRVDGEQLPVSVEPFARLTVFPALEIRYDADGLLVGGRVDVPRGAVEIQSLPETAVRVSEDEEVVGEEVRAEALPLRMDLLVVVGEDRVSFEGFGVTGNLRGQLRLVDEMEARGELGLIDGRYQIYGQRLTIRRAQLIFSGPLDEPFLDIEAVREVGDVVAGIRLTGRAEEPQAEIFSEPAMSEQQALSYLVFGRPLRTEGDSNVVGEVALALGLAQAAPVTRELGEMVGIRDLQLEQEGVGDEASVVASGYITDRLSLRYGVGLFQPVNRLAVRYDLTRQVFLEAASGLADSIDIFYQRDY